MNSGVYVNCCLLFQGPRNDDDDDQLDEFGFRVFINSWGKFYFKLVLITPTSVGEVNFTLRRRVPNRAVAVYLQCAS